MDKKNKAKTDPILNKLKGRVLFPKKVALAKKLLKNATLPNGGTLVLE